MRGAMRRSSARRVGECWYKGHATWSGDWEWDWLYVWIEDRGGMEEYLYVPTERREAWFCFPTRTGDG